ncbi:MAG: hypothetical protein F4X47_00825 [Gammaproteobacteria bacterium]|nr:hypothetical protein [Gammaproteobacteria bacterium]MYC50842.1 hypothetical protein [Gammaproteobacteria bacterium]
MGRGAQALRRPAARAQEAVSAAPLLLQRRRRSLRGLPGSGPGRNRDDLHGGRLHTLRHLPGDPLQERDPGRDLQGAPHRPGAGAHRRPGHPLLHEAKAPRKDPLASAGRGARLPAARPARPHPFRGGGPAAQDRPRTVRRVRAAGQQALHPGRAHHRALRQRSGQAPAGSDALDRRRKHGHCHRAQPGCDSRRGLDHRSGTRRRSPRRTGSRHGPPARGDGGERERDRCVPRPPPGADPATDEVDVNKKRNGAALPPGPAVLAGIALIWVAGARPAHAQAFELPPIPIDTFSLDNGLRVIVSEDHSAPVVAVNMWYHVGSAHEVPGRTGFAHFFEHLVFEETENLGNGDFARLVNNAGGTYNGTTSTDRTAYFETLPSNRVNLSFWLHAERMARLVVSERGFENQREVVKEERRLRIDNVAYAQANIVLDSLSTDYEPYRHTPIGSMEDLDAATTDDVKDFYERYYVPNNATLAVAGAVTTEQIRALAEEYFGSIPRGEDVPPLPDPPVTPRTDGERTASVSDEHARLPFLYMGYNVPEAGHPDVYPLAVLSQVFSAGESSRLHQRLVKQDELAPVVISGLQQRLGSGLMLFGSLPHAGGNIEEIRAVIEQEIEKLKADGITERELEKALNQQRAAQVASRMTVSAKASILQSFALTYGDPFEVNNVLFRYEAVTLDDVLNVARKYLVPENRTVVVARPTGGVIP